MSLFSMEEICIECNNAIFHECCNKFCKCNINEEYNVNPSNGNCDKHTKYSIILLNKLNKMINVIPDGNDLKNDLKNILDSVRIAAPEMIDMWENKITNNLEYFLPFPLNLKWEKKIYKIWMNEEYKEN